MMPFRASMVNWVSDGLRLPKNYEGEAAAVRRATHLPQTNTCSCIWGYNAFGGGAAKRLEQGVPRDGS